MTQLDLPPHLALTPGLAAILDGMPLEQLAFTPVAVRPRHDGWSPARQRAFILRLALVPCVSKAARAVGKSAQSAYALRRGELRPRLGYGAHLGRRAANGLRLRPRAPR